MPQDNTSYGSQANASAICTFHRQYVLNANATLSTGELEDAIILTRNLPALGFYLFQSVGGAGARWFAEFAVDDDFGAGSHAPLWLPLTTPAALALGVPTIIPIRFAVNFARIRLTAPAGNAVTVDVVVSASL